MKVRINLAEEAWHNQGAEHLWAEAVGASGLRLRNSPFYAYELSAGDIVAAERDDSGQLVLRNVIARGGHSTYRIMLRNDLTDESQEFEGYWKRLASLGCSYEGLNNRYLAVDVPSRTSVSEAYAGFEAGEEAGVWGFEEAHLGHPVN